MIWHFNAENANFENREHGTTVRKWSDLDSGEHFILAALLLGALRYYCIAGHHS